MFQYVMNILLYCWYIQADTDKVTLITTYFLLLYTQVGKSESEPGTHLYAIHLTVEKLNVIWYLQKTQFKYIQL